MYYSKFAATAATLAPLAAAQQIQNMTLVIRSPSDPTLDNRSITLYHSSAGESYAVAGSAILTSPESEFSIGTFPNYFGASSVLQTSEILQNTEVPCEVALFQAMSGGAFANAGQLQCGVEATNATGNYFAINPSSDSLQMAGIQSFYVCDTLAASGRINDTIVGSTDGNVPDPKASVNNGTFLVFANCKTLGAGGEIAFVPVPAASAATSAGPAMSSSSPVSMPATIQSTISISGMASGTSVPVISQISDGQIQATTPLTTPPTTPPTSTTTSIPVVSQISDGQIQAMTPITSPPALYTGAANMLGYGRQVGMVAAGAAAFAMV